MTPSRKLFLQNFDYNYESKETITSGPIDFANMNSPIKYGYSIHGSSIKIESIDTRNSNARDVSTREVSYTELPTIEMFDTQMWRGLIHETTDYRHTVGEMFDTRKKGRLERIDTRKTA